MAKKKAIEPPVRKSVLVGGGIVIGVAVLGFIVSTFVLGGGGGGDAKPAANANPVATAAPAAQVPGSDGVPATGNTAAGSDQFPENNLNPGGKNPFAPKASGTSSASTSGSVLAAAAKAPDLKNVPHTWQLLSVKDGKGTFIVDGKKISGVATGKTILGDYVFKSVTGGCAAVAKGTKAFVLCTGAAPFSI